MVKLCVMSCLGLKRMLSSYWDFTTYLTLKISMLGGRDFLRKFARLLGRNFLKRVLFFSHRIKYWNRGDQYYYNNLKLQPCKKNEIQIVCVCGDDLISENKTFTSAGDQRVPAETGPDFAYKILNCFLSSLERDFKFQGRTCISLVPSQSIFFKLLPALGLWSNSGSIKIEPSMHK